jgi:hypothetical protein
MAAQGVRGRAVRGPSPWRDELARVRLTRDMIATCVAPSPRQAAWLARTDAALRLLERHWRDLTAHSPIRWGG